MKNVIFHVDINSYFATMLQQENPALRGKPVGVIKDTGRTCIIAASKEAKKLGVSTGARVPEARQIIPDLITVPVHFGMMLSATRKLKEIFVRVAPIVHVFSLDEVFLDLTGCEALIRQKLHFCQPEPDASAIKREDPTRPSRSVFCKVHNDTMRYASFIQSRIKEVLGNWVTCNVGISHNKLLAKMAGEIAPKGGVLVIDAQNLDAILASVEFKDVCGVGRGLQKKLAMLGVSHPYEMNLIDDDTLTRVVGPYWAVELRKIGLGEETSLLGRVVDSPGDTPPSDLPLARGEVVGGGSENQHQQSVGRTITGYKLTDDEGEIRRILLNLLEEATYKLRAMDLCGRKVGISLWGREAHWGEHRTLKYWVRHTSEIWRLLYDGMYKQWKRDFPVIKFGVWIGDCQPISVTPQALLPEWGKSERLYGIVDRVNDRFGSFTLMPATMLGGRVIRPEVTGYLGDRKYLGL